MAAAPERADPAILCQLKALAQQHYPLGEIARRLAIPIREAQSILDLAKIHYVRDNRTGGPRAVLTSRVTAHSYTASLREGFVARMDHTRRLSKARPLTAAEEQEAIARFLRDKGVTHCPSVHLDAGFDANSQPQALGGSGRRASRR